MAVVLDFRNLCIKTNPSNNKNQILVVFFTQTNLIFEEGRGAKEKNQLVQDDSGLSNQFFY